MHLKFGKDKKVILELSTFDFSEFQEKHNSIKLTMTMDEFLDFCEEMRDFLTSVKGKVTDHKKALEEVPISMEKPVIEEETVTPSPDSYSTEYIGTEYSK